jgi:UDP-galactopyranose mutase
MGRVPVRISSDDRYCADEYQFMPQNGFTEMVANILRHPKIRLKLKTDIKKEIALSNGQVYFGGKPLDGILIYTGCVDELFDYKYGVLPYRSLKFKFKTLKTSSFQPSAVVNYTTSHAYTRISEFSKFTCEPKENTVIVKEYSKTFKKGRDIPYYPIPIEKNYKHYAKYQEEAKQYKNLHLLGRLANYKYVNMDLAVKNAMDLFESIINGEI